MKHLNKSLFVFTLLLSNTSFAVDDLSGKIAIGLTREAVVSLLGGSSLDNETCTNYLGVSSCTLVFTKGFAVMGKTRYTVSLLANRVVFVKTSKQNGIL